MPGIRLDIPGFGTLTIRRLVTDYSGTLACAGVLSAEVRGRLERVSEVLEIHVVTSDTFGTAKRRAGCPSPSTTEKGARWIPWQMPAS